MEDKLNPDKSGPEGDMWTNCIEDSLVDIFTRIWGEAQFPKAHRLRNLSTISEPLHALKWLSQQLYRRRVHLLGSGKECMFEFVERARNEHSKIREAIEEVHTGNKDVIKHAQNEILFDCGERGALEIRLMKTFKKRSSRFSYMDKKYDDEIEDLEANIVHGTPNTIKDLMHMFTPTIATIIGFFPLLTAALKKAGHLVVYFPSEQNFYTHRQGRTTTTRAGGKRVKGKRSKGKWVRDIDLLTFCETLHDALGFACKNMREMLLEKIDFTSSDIPESPQPRRGPEASGPEADDKFSKWFYRIFDDSHSREFVNAFELVWLLEEIEPTTGEPLLYSFVRKEVIKRMSRSITPNDVLVKTYAKNDNKIKRHLRDENGPKRGDAAFKNVFNPNAGFAEIKRTCTLFAREWRACTTNGTFRKSIVTINRW